MAFSYGLPRTEPYSPWERKHASKHGFPFSDRPQRYWCFKNKCDAIFPSLGRVAQHEKFAHSRHPITGDYGDWLERIEEEEEVNADVVKVKKEVTVGRDRTHRKMMRMGMEFFRIEIDDVES
ncbi:hypothetical protein BDZ45DRAFT_741959 [Acephala macrosclerotiorum]|nr:hypothetical protein BDZ45DRAFT_741959 [Acephala macrosclerotiorum]